MNVVRTSRAPGYAIDLCALRISVLVERAERCELRESSPPSNRRARTNRDHSLAVPNHTDRGVARDARSSSFASALSTGVRTLGANPLRSVLSTLGIVIGVASLVAVLSLGDGMAAYARREISTTTDVQSMSISPVLARVEGGSAFRVAISWSSALGMRATLPYAFPWRPSRSSSRAAG